MTQPLIEVHRWAPGSMPAEAFEAIQVLKDHAFGLPETEQEAREETVWREKGRRWWVDGVFESVAQVEPRRVLYHLLSADGALASIAQTSVRTIYLEHGAGCDILTLAGVVSEPAIRGRGLGAAVIRDAFARLEEEGLKHCLFQTGRARPLYERLGATLVTNGFVNGCAATREKMEARPWDDDWVMRYPASSAWFEGVIDLNGPGY
ncbi:MAG: GNAT family N-acetyltransferase [Planctomycetota bacterium]